MARMTPFSSPLMLGFDDLERLLDRVSKSASDGYPPYNIERVRIQDGETRLRLTFAVAGFGRSEIEITVEEHELTIIGRNDADDGGDYLYRGIAARDFKRTFILAEGMEVAAAKLADGLLSIDVVRQEPQRQVRRIEISKVGVGKD